MSISNTFKIFAGLGLVFIVAQCFECKANNERSELSFKAGQLTKSTDFGGIELSLLSLEEVNAEPLSTSNQSELLVRPEISLFTSASNRNSSQMSTRTTYSRGGAMTNRYKNTIPTVYRLTLKGFSVMEYSDNTAQTWSLDRVKDKTLRKPEIMFSITKQF